MEATRKREIKRKAASFRTKCNAGQYGIIDLFKSCEECSFKLLRYPLGEDADLGFTLKKDDDIIVFTNTSSRLSREIFTLAHEIGHVILHMESTVSFIDDSVTISGRSTDEMEKEANYFAACLLMPEDKVSEFLDLEINDFNKNGLSAMDIARIMSGFSVSFDMVLNRLENLGKIDCIQKVQLESERNQRRVSNLLRSVGGNSRLNEASKEIDIPHEYIDYAIYNYNHKAIPMETLEKVLECYHLTIEDVNDRIVKHSEEEEDLDDLIGGLAD